MSQITIESNAMQRMLATAAELGAKKAIEDLNVKPHSGWLTEQEACEFLKCEKTTLFRLRKKKLITVSLIQPRQPRYSIKSLISFIEDNATR